MTARSSLSLSLSLGITALSLLGMTGCAGGTANEEIAAPRPMVAYPEISAADCLSRVQPLSTPKHLKRLVSSRSK